MTLTLALLHHTAKHFGDATLLQTFLRRHMPISAAVQALLQRHWHSEPGASDEELATLERELSFRLPDEYRALLCASNGGEGPLTTAPLRLCLYDVAFTRDMWKDPFYREQFASYFFFGSNGGGDSIAIDISSGEVGSIVTIDCIAGEGSKEIIAPDFSHFLANVGREVAE